MDNINIDGKSFQAYTIKTTNASLLIINGKKGMLDCGYVKVETADKLGDVLAIVTGVNSYDDMRLKPVVAVSKAAEALGIKPGMSGGQALAILA